MTNARSISRGSPVLDAGSSITASAKLRVHRRHAFDKLRAIDLPLREFQALLEDGEVIAEAAVGILAHKELVLLVQWRDPLHVAIVVDEAREEERIVTVYEPDRAEWSTDFRRRR